MSALAQKSSGDTRREFIGGSDARVIVGPSPERLVELWRQKRGELEPAALDGELLVQLGLVTEDLNRRWYEKHSQRQVISIQKRVFHSTIPWLACTLDGIVEEQNAVFESKFMLPWSFSEEAAAEKYMPQLQHNMFVCGAKLSVLSVITGGGKWVEITVPADPIYQAVLLEAERDFWDCVQTGREPRLLNAEPPRPRIEAVRSVDMSGSNSWAEWATLFLKTREAHAEHERAKAELKAIVPEDAKEAAGHGVRAKRSKSGAISFDLTEAAYAAV